MNRLFIAAMIFMLSLGLAYAATKAEVLQAIADKDAEIKEAIASHSITSELACNTQYWAHNMINARYQDGVWYYTCRAPWEGDGTLATNVYYYGQRPDLYN